MKVEKWNEKYKWKNVMIFYHILIFGDLVRTRKLLRGAISKVEFLPNLGYFRGGSHPKFL